MKITVSRIGDLTIESKGNLSLDSNPFKCPTLELKWADNAQGLSCIPPGIYTWNKVGPSHIPYPHIAINGVPGREGICIHYGNFAAGAHIDILGCILVGSSYADINGDGIPDIVNSKATFEKLMGLLLDNGTIEIINQNQTA